MKREPVIAAAIARLIVTCAAAKGLELDLDATLALIVAIEAVAAPLVRSLVSPVPNGDPQL